MKVLQYTIEIFNKEGNRYKTDEGSNVVNTFKFESNETDENLIGIVCKHTYDAYKAVCKEGSKIYIDVRYFDNITKTYPLLYSYHGSENRFIKH